MGSETGSGVKPVKGDVPSEPVYGLDATSSSMVGASRWAEEGGQLNGMEERWGLVQGAPGPGFQDRGIPS